MLAAELGIQAWQMGQLRPRELTLVMTFLQELANARKGGAAL